MLIPWIIFRSFIWSKIMNETTDLEDVPRGLQSGWIIVDLKIKYDLIQNLRDWFDLIFFNFF